MPAPDRRTIEEIVDTARGRVDPERAEAFGELARPFLAAADARTLRSRGADRLGAVAHEVFAFADRRRRGELRTRVRSPEDRPGRTVVEVVQDDRPFVVDTIRLVLRRHDLREQLFVHPLLDVARDAEGRIERVGPGAGPRESLIYAEVAPRVSAPERLAALEDELRAVMDQVRDVTDDHHRMIRAVRALAADVEFAGRLLPDGEARAARVVRFLEWLLAEHFVLAGFRHYRIERAGGDMRISLERGSGLGLWRPDGTSHFFEPKTGPAISEEFRAALADRRMILIDKSREVSRIHRAGRFDRVTVKQYDDDGRLRGFSILIGLLTHRALRTPASQIPILTERLQQVLAGDGAQKGSHRWKRIVAAFDSAPVELLLGSDVEGIGELIHEIVGSEGTTDVRLVIRRDETGRSFYAGVLLPRERYGERLRASIRAWILRRTAATYSDDRTSFLEEGTALLHFFCTSSSGALEIPDVEQLEREVKLLCARWEDHLLEALVERHGEGEGPVLAARYEAAFPDAYRLLTHPADAVRDVEALEALHATGEPQFALYFDRSGRAPEASLLKIFLPESRLLSDLLPVVDHFGLRVIDARQTELHPAERPAAVVNTLRVLPLGGAQEDLDAIAPRLSHALRAVLTGRVPDDVLNALVLGAGLDWRQVDCVRAYVEYFNQIQGALTRPFVRSVLLENPLAVRLLVQYHAARLDPSVPEASRAAREEELRAAFDGYRDRISSLNEDRALGALQELIGATLRTSFFAPVAGTHRIAFKLDPAAVSALPPPHPYREIFVHSARMQGVHIRGGPVARGGLRWSDRIDDFRTEVFDLMRTQTLKNGIIVPVGAKGGFVLTRVGLVPNEARALADEQYRVFVSGLLDLTDNLDAEGRVRPPEGVLRRDGDDPYLVVAADKGTAHLSDAANEIALARDFWLGDAFASGGSEGYDHKRYGITARGAWECVVHHFAELGIDPARDTYTVAGIGDMSGDVFGNGLLGMRRAKLVAAFDHRHVFLDPDPDPEASFRERERLFALPRSSWADYDPAKLSPGGGVFPRAAKRIPLSPEARERLGVEAAELTGNELVRAILAAPVDLLWNGGIGTYVKASRERHADVGDRANDAVRIDGRELACRVVGEGGNLGLTQAGRVEAALHGVRLETDAIDNSAGVDLSDHEVNFKIGLAPLVRSGRLGAAERREALFGVADEACEHVLSHNRGQALALSLDELRAAEDPEPFLRAAQQLCQAEGQDPAELELPDAAAIGDRRAAGRSWVRPELSVLLGLARIHLLRGLSESGRAADPATEGLYRAYFPPAFAERFPEALAGHRLRGEITALQITNRLIDAGGATLLSSLVGAGGFPPAAAAGAMLTAEELLQAPAFRERLLALAAPALRETVYAALLSLDRGARDVARYLLAARREAPEPGTIARWRAGLLELRAHLSDFLSEGEALRMDERRGQLETAGLPPDLAADVAALPLADRGLNVVRIGESIDAAPVDAALVYARIGEASGLNWVYARMAEAETADAWDRMVLTELRTELLDLQRELTEAVLSPKPPEPLAAADAFLASRRDAIERVRALQHDAAASARASALAVVVQALRRLRQ